MEANRSHFISFHFILFDPEEKCLHSLHSTLLSDFDRRKAAFHGFALTSIFTFIFTLLAHPILPLPLFFPLLQPPSTENTPPQPKINIPNIQLNVPAIATSLSTKPHNVTCRISSLRKRYGLNITCASTGTGSSNGTGTGLGLGPATPPPSAKKGRPATGGGGAVRSGRVTKSSRSGGTGAKKGNGAVKDSGAAERKGRKKVGGEARMEELSEEDGGEGRVEDEDGDGDGGGDDKALGKRVGKEIKMAGKRKVGLDNGVGVNTEGEAEAEADGEMAIKREKVEEL